MFRKQILALGGATVALALGAAPALAAGTTVTVRVEGLKRTLLAPTIVHTHAGSITKGGAPGGRCPATSAAGALDVATHHHWAGKWFSFGDILVSTILGEKASGSNYYWGFWVNNRYASLGVCETKLHKGDQLLFAVDSFKHHEHPIGVRAPRKALAGREFNVKLVSFSDAGKATPLAGATLMVGHDHFRSNRRGIVKLVVRHAGTYSLGGEKAGYIRAAPVRVRVTV
jgi:hypothetical protein